MAVIGSVRDYSYNRARICKSEWFMETDPPYDGISLSYMRNALRRWCARHRWFMSLTRIPPDVIFHCLEFLSDGDLWRVSMTCHLFYQAFRILVRGCGSKKESAFLVKLASRGHEFIRVKVLNLHFPNVKKWHSKRDYLKYVRPERFPCLSILKLRYLCVQALPWHPQVSWLQLIGCEFDGTLPFPYPNLKFLLLQDSANDISSKNPLPRLCYLEELILKWSAVSQSLNGSTLPYLKRLEIKGDNVKEIRLPKLEVLSLDFPQNYNLRALPNLVSLTVFKNGDCCFLEMITAEKYPKLKKLDLDLGVEWNNLDLSLLPTHSAIRHLRVACRGTVDVSNLTVENFPNLTTVEIDADLLDLSKLPSHDLIENLVVPASTNTSLITRRKWPKITTINRKMFE